MDGTVPKHPSRGCPYRRSLTALASGTPLWEQSRGPRFAVNPPGSPGWGPPRAIQGQCRVLPVPGHGTCSGRAEHPTTSCKSRANDEEPRRRAGSDGDALHRQPHCTGVHGALVSPARLLQPFAAERAPPPPPPTYGHGVSGDVVLLAVLNHLLQVWAVVRLSICDYNHYSLCPFPATFLKRFRAAIEEMPWAAQPRQPGRRSHRRAPAETAAAAETRAPSPAW